MTAPKSKLYTKTGDQGTTKLVDGSCVEKFNPRVEAYGCVDELNSHIGVVRAFLRDDSFFSSQKQNQDRLDKILFAVQNELFVIGSLLACSDPALLEQLPQLKENHVSAIELAIDEMDHELPALKNFILPGGSKLSSLLHVCRTSCRRAERRSAEIQSGARNPLCLIYLNRLSDFLFVAARWVNQCQGQSEVNWVKP